MAIQMKSRGIIKKQSQLGRRNAFSSFKELFELCGDPSVLADRGETCDPKASEAASMRKVPPALPALSRPYVRERITVKPLPASEDLKLWDKPGQDIMDYHKAKVVAMVAGCEEIPPDLKDKVVEKALGSTGKPLAEGISDAAAELGIFKETKYPALPLQETPAPRASSCECSRPATHALPPSEEGMSGQRERLPMDHHMYAYLYDKWARPYG